MHTTSNGRRLLNVVIAMLACAVLIAGCSDGSTPKPTTTSRTSTQSPAPPPSTPEPKRPSGMIFDSGVVGHRVELSTKFAKERGRPLDVLGVSPTRDSWADLMGAWWLSSETIPADFQGTLNVAMPLFPDDGDMRTAARGGYDAQWKKFAKTLAAKYPTAYVRPGWEMNINNWPWAATPDNVEDYKKAFRAASRAMKRQAPGLRIVWNVNEGKGNSLPDARQAWPGDDVVDIVAMDAYDWSPPYDAKGWETHKTQEGGWDFWGTFARQRGKQFALPEWGVITGNDGSGGDNPNFINSAYAWMQGNEDIMAFESYFDETEPYCKCALSLNPNARSAYLSWMPRLSVDGGSGSGGGATTAPTTTPAARTRSSSAN